MRLPLMPSSRKRLQASDVAGSLRNDIQDVQATLPLVSAYSIPGAQLDCGPAADDWLGLGDTP